MMSFRNALFFLVLLPASALGQDEARIDPGAVAILDHMSGIIGDLSSLSVTVRTAQDVQDNTFFVPEDNVGNVKQFAEHQVSLSGPNRFQVDTRNERGHFGYWFNGDYLAFYSYTNNHFSVLETDSLASLDVIYLLHQDYEVEFPAADFFNPSFTDDLLNASDRLLFLGEKAVEGKPCFHLLAKMADMSVQLWISNDALTLPVKMVINYLDREDNPQYEATYTHWELNPVLPEALFNFVPPGSATTVTLVPVTEH